MGVSGSTCQDWAVDLAHADLQSGSANGGVVSASLPIKHLTLAPLSRHLDLNKKGGCEERTLRRSQTGQAQLGLSCEAMSYVLMKHHHALMMPAQPARVNAALSTSK